MGLLAGELAWGGLTEGLKRLSGIGEATTSALLTATNADRLAKRLSSMRGAAMKLGQLMSMEGADFLPPEFTRALTILRADADAMPHTQLRRILARAYGKAWQERFLEFSFEPIAAASIGQVHRVVTADGRDIVLKIQYPGVARSIDSDVDNLATALRLSRMIPAGVDLSDILAETKRQLRHETDYLREAQALQRYADLISDDSDLVVPRVHEDLTTHTILAMDRLEGVPLQDLAGDTGTQRQRDRAGEILYRLLFRELLEFRYMQTDPNPANFFYLPREAKIGLLDFGAARDVPESFARLYARIFLAGMGSDRDAMREAITEIGFVRRDERPDRIDAVTDLFLLGCEPFRHRGVYDFAASTIPERAREMGLELTFRKGFFQPPPAVTLFLQRKLGGTFMLCARLGARVDARRALKSVLSPGPLNS
jgi:predicted unusual protein kinase regulating ubiquinone biosynthesis (AarF/ABC1/UbiB family)